MVPPDQRLDADEPAVVERELGLVVHDELAQAHASSQRALGVEPLEGLAAQLGVELLVTGAAVGLRPVHGNVGVRTSVSGVTAASPSSTSASATAMPMLE